MERELHTELEALPKGTIVRRMIRGTARFYHQWRENGVTKNRYLRPGEIEPLRAKLDRRKYLEGLDGSVTGVSAEASFRCDVLTGGLLAEYAAGTARFRNRDAFADEFAFLAGGGERPRFLVGPCGVGKTTLLRQLVHALPPTLRAQTAYLRLTGVERAADLTADLSRLRDLGFRRVLVDDAERLDGLPGAGMTLLLAGTSVPAAFRDGTDAVDLGFIPFRELRRLTGETEVGALASHGGTLDRESAPPPLTAAEARSNDRFVLEVLASVTTHRLAQRFAERAGLAGDDGDGTSAREALLGVPAVRRAVHAVRRIDWLLDDPLLNRLGAAERKTLRDTLTGALGFRLLEDAVWNELRHAQNGSAVEVKRIPFAPDANAFVAANGNDLSCEVFVVTTDSARSPEHLRYLDDPARLDAVEHRYGLITGRTVLYSGRDARLASGVSYRNLFNYLTRLRPQTESRKER